MVVELEHGAAVGVGGSIHLQPRNYIKQQQSTLGIQARTLSTQFSCVIMTTMNYYVSFRHASRHVEGAQQEPLMS